MSLKGQLEASLARNAALEARVTEMSAAVRGAFSRDSIPPRNLHVPRQTGDTATLRVKLRESGAQLDALERLHDETKAQLRSFTTQEAAAEAHRASLRSLRWGANDVM